MEAHPSESSTLFTTFPKVSIQRGFLKSLRVCRYVFPIICGYAKSIRREGIMPLSVTFNFYSNRGIIPPIFNVDEPWNVFRSIVFNFLRNLKCYVMLIFRIIELNSLRIFYGLMKKNEITIQRIFLSSYIRSYIRNRFSSIKITLNSAKKMVLQISKKIWKL